MSNYIKTIKSIELKNFKGYRLSESGVARFIDMTVSGRPADLILVTGKNGVGKTSLLEAIDWVLNQPDVGAGGFRTNRERDGSVSINEMVYQLQGKAKPDIKNLKTIASFFYQENIADLACNEIIQLLEPESKPADEIRRGLKLLQSRLESWQRQIHVLKYRKNYEEERKTFAAKINQLVEMLPFGSPLRHEMMESTLTLKNGNLQNMWHSQIRKLSNSIGTYSNLTEAVGSKLSDQLQHIGQSLLEYRSPQVDRVGVSKDTPVFTKRFLSSIQSLPPALPIKRLLGETSLSPVELESTLFVGSGVDIYAETEKAFEKKQTELTAKYQSLSQLMQNLDGDGGSLLGWINAFGENVSNWLKVWEGHPQGLEVSNLKKDIEHQLEAMSNLTHARTLEIHDQLDRVTSEGRLLAEKLNQIKRYQGIARDINTQFEALSHLLDGPSFNAEDLSKFVSEYLLAKNKTSVDKPSSYDEPEITYKLGNLFLEWAKIEIEKVEDEANATDLESVELAEKMLSDALAICKQESTARSQLLSVVGVIPQAELQQLLKNMNWLLESFHFPEAFLPIVLVDSGTEKSPKWGFATQSDVKFEDLSTGQKSQLAICWTINLNLALSAHLGHRVIGFDDFTTSLDMNQLIPAAVLLRKLAYANTDDSWKRQVIVTSHHEDLTNRLLDFLLPPAGMLMKVIQFEDWLPESGPQFRCYNVNMGEVNGEGLQDALMRVVKTAS